MVSPRDQENFYLRFLLLNVKGAIGYADLRTVDGVEYDTFQGACEALGLLEDDSGWDNALSEAAVFRSPYNA